MTAALLAGCASVRTPPPLAPSRIAPPAPTQPAEIDRCGAAPGFASAAAFNAVTMRELQFSPFGRPESGWAIYAPQAAATIATDCAPDSEGFAAALSVWQGAHQLTPDGALSPETFQTLKGVWQEKRPFVMLHVAGGCPAGADAATLEALRPDEIMGDKTVLLRPRALAALRSLVAAARDEVLELQADPLLLTAFSGYRDPMADAARCATEQNCQGRVRAECSAHRTGLAVDLNVGYAPGFMADQSADANRLYQSRTAAYRWLVRNAARFGFVNYVFEPWHWEWTGEAP